GALHGRRARPRAHAASRRRADRRRQEAGGVKTAIATVSLSGSPEQKLAAAAGAGFDAVELFEPDLIAPRLSPRDVRELASGLGVAIPMYQPFRDFEGI